MNGSIDGNQYIGVDFRYVSTSRVRNVKIDHVQIGVLLYQTAYYNVVEDVIVDSTVECFEVVDGANENILRGGKCQNAGAPARGGIGIWLRNVDDVKIFGTSFENLDIGIKVDTGADTTSIFAPRLENMNYGIRLLGGATKTTIYSPYKQNLSNALVADSGVSYLYYGY